MTSVSCNVCGGVLDLRFGDVVDPGTRERFAIEACTNCGLGHTTPTPEDLGRYYGQRYYGGRHGFTAAHCARRRARLVDSAARSGRKGALLDVGCGDGTFLLEARGRGWNVVGTEMNPELARSAGLEVYESVAEASTRAPFDCITLWHCLEHVRNPKEMIESLVPLLAADGIIVVAVPDAEGMQASVFGPAWFHLDVPRHLFHFGDRSLTLLLQDAGLTVERRLHQELEYDLLGWLQSALNRMLSAPNILFDRLTGRDTAARRGEVGASYVMGTLLSPLALSATAVGTMAGRGGTIIAIARRR